jgi:Putative phage tail protein
LGKVLKLFYGPVLGLVLDGKEGFIRGLQGLAAALSGPITFAIYIGSSLLATKPKSPQRSAESIDRLNASIIPRTARKFVFGTTALSTDIRDQEYTDNQTYLHRFIVVASHKVNAISEIWFDDKIAWTLAGGVQGEYVGYLTVAPILEGSAGNAINISARMGSNRRFTGMAYVHLRYKLTGNSKKTDSPFAQSIPSRMTIRGNGALVYDPRLDSTVAGGSGSHRADDQSTWAWSSSGSRNPALQLLWWMLGYKINGILAVGKGIPKERINLESFAIAANACDEPVTLLAGGTEPRYRSDQAFSEGDATGVVLDSLKTTMNADLDDVDGLLRLTVFYNDLAFPIAHFTDDDIIDSFNWQQTPDLNDSFNIVRGAYTDPSNTSLYQPAEYPQIYVAAPDGIDRIDSFDVPGVHSVSQAQRLAKQRLQRQIFGGTFTTSFNARGWKVQKNDVITLTLSRLGWVNKLFRVSAMEHRVDGICPVTLREENAAIYAWDQEEGAAVVQIAPTLYDFNLSAINSDFNAALVDIVPPPAQTVYADYAGTPMSGQFPRVLKPSVYRGGVDIRTSNEATYSITSSGVTATVNNTTAHAEKGWITVTDGGSGFIDLTITISGIVYGPYRSVFSKTNAAAPINGSGSGSRSSFAAISLTTFVDLFSPATPITLTVGTGQTVTMTAPLEYNTYAASTDAGAYLECKWQRSPTGAGTWTDISPNTTGSLSTWNGTYYTGAPGSGNFGATDNPSAGTYDYKMSAQRVFYYNTPSIYIFSGTATAIVS